MLCDLLSSSCCFDLIAIFLCCCVGQFTSVKNQNGQVTAGDLPSLMVKSKAFKETYSEEEIRNILSGLGSNLSDEIDFESFLKVSHFVLSLFLIDTHSHARTYNVFIYFLFLLFWSQGVWDVAFNFLSFKHGVAL